MDNSLALTQSYAREEFLQHATSVDDWNTRAIFYELVHIPTQDDVEVYCKGKFIERWKVRPHYGGFFWHCEGMQHVKPLTRHHLTKPVTQQPIVQVNFRNTVHSQVLSTEPLAQITLQYIREQMFEKLTLRKLRSW